MADPRSSQPIQSIATSNPVKVSADLNANASSNPIFTQLADGTNSIDLVVINSAFGATPTVMPIAGKYEATPTSYTDGDAVPLLTDANGRLQVDIVSGGNASVAVDDTAFTPATSSVTITGFFADDTATDSVDEGDLGAARMTLDRKQLMVIADPTTDANRLGINASGEVGVVQATHDDLNLNANIQVGDTDVSSSNPVPVSKDGSANSSSNPIFVNVVEAAVSSTEFIDYDTAASVATSATSDHDYTVTAASTAIVQRIMASCAQALRVEISAGPVAGLVSQAVKFSSGANRNVDFDFEGRLEVPDTSTGTIRVSRTNIGDSASDVYSTIIGNEV